MLKSAFDFGRVIFLRAILDIALCEAFLNSYGGHILNIAEIAFYTEDCFYEHRILVDLITLLYEVSLAYRLDETYLIEVFFESRGKAKRDGGLAVILHCSGYKYLLRHRLFLFSVDKHSGHNGRE